MYTKHENFQDKKLNTEHLSKKFLYEIKYLEEYLTFTQELADEKNTQLADKMYKDTELAPENENIIQEIFDNERKALLSYYHHSSIVLIYSVLESILSDICDEVKKISFAKFSHKDLSGGNLIKKTKDYLEITSGLDFSKISGDWAEIGKFQNLRNVIVHQNSCFTGDESSIQKQKNKIINNFPSIEISEATNKFYILDTTILGKFIQLVKNFTLKIFNHVQSQIYQIKPCKEIKPIFDNNIPF
ncbi:hypothetical protein [Pectobacterium carotovorum]|uniref:hypothetical protein n=1 Tax=Pectobacterium carotovorum TaxID=554 RepID=UPI003018048F